MLEIKCGAADRSHENRFFRYFASQLKEAFDKTGRDGILLGMPECKVRDNLQMDALLITDSSLSIIDFKDYGGCEVALPGEDDFDSGLWRTDGGITVRGGSSRNPYAQLMRQRRLLREILDRLCRHKTGSFDSAHISTMVCFSGRVTIAGAIPGWARLKFFIADSESFLERVYDIVNVHGVGLLGSEFATSMLDTLFEAQPFECDMKPTRPFAPAVPLEPQQEATIDPLAGQDATYTDAIRSFFDGNQDVLIISSIDPTLRSQLALCAQAVAHDIGFSEARILAPTKLAGDNLCAGMPLDGSLYSEIYDTNSRAIGEDGTERVALGRLVDHISLRYEVRGQGQEPVARETSDETPTERTTLIVCESQLVTSERWVDGPVVFGSGRLLLDTLDYMKIDGGNRGSNKIVFIGDDCQLNANSCMHSSLHEGAYPNGVQVSHLDIPIDVPSDEYSEYISTLASCIRANDYSLLSLDSNSENPRIVEHNLKQELPLIADASQNWRTHRIVASTNKKANGLNLTIKRRILRNGDNLCPGDILVFSDVQFEATACEPLSGGFATRRIRNGEFAKVTHVGNAIMSLPVDACEDEGPGLLTLVPIHFLPEGCLDEYEACIIYEYLYSEKAKLSVAQVETIKRKMSEIERAKLQEMPYGPGNPWYEQMVHSEDYVILKDKAGTVRYRQKSDQRRMTPQEAEYRKHVERTLDTPGTAYHLLKNLARARYGWALTVHKARYYRWDTVTLSTNVDMGRSTEGFFRYLYTGSTRAREQLNIVRWEDVSPFAKTEFDESPSSVRKKTRRSVLFRASPNLPIDQQIASCIEQSHLVGIQAEHSASSNWREAFTFSRNETEAVLAFDYNKAGDVFYPRLERGDAGLFTDVSDLFAHENHEGVQDSPISTAYEYVEQLSAGGTTISVVRSDKYRDEIQVENQVGTFLAAVHHGDDKLVSRVELQSGDKDAFGAFRRLLGKTDEPSGSRDVS